jgi:hypothetical protein
MFEDNQVSLVWSAPTSEEYTPQTNLGKLLLSVGFELGSEIKASSLINMKGRCIVNDYTKQVTINGKTEVVTYSVVGELVIPTAEEESND